MTTRYKITITAISALLSLCFALFVPIVPYHASLISVAIFIFLSRSFNVSSIVLSISYGSIFLIAPFLIAFIALATSIPILEALKLALNSYSQSDAIIMEFSHIILALVLSILVYFFWPINKVKNTVPSARTPQKTRRPF